MSIAEQALNLLDIVPSINNRKNLENFSGLEQTIDASLNNYSLNTETKTANSAQENPYSVASRMNRANHEDQLKAEALMNALRQIRANHVSRPSSSRVIRKS